MRKSRFSKAQIIVMIKELGCRLRMCAASTVSVKGRSTSSSCGMEVSDVAKLRTVTDESAKLKRLLADTMLDNVVLKDLLGKNG